MMRHPKPQPIVDGDMDDPLCDRCEEPATWVFPEHRPNMREAGTVYEMVLMCDDHARGAHCDD